MAKLLRLDVAQLTDVGRRREHNEDNMAYVIPKDPQVMTQKGALFIVADGMGGHAAGEVASEIAVDTVSNAYYQDDNDDVAASLLQAIRRANAAIHQRAAENMLRSGMGTTCVAAVLRGNAAYIANIGDSRAYLVRKAQIRQVSQDHSWVAEQVRAGLLSEEQARTHTQRNVITRSLGTQPEVEIDLFRETLEEGDTLMLCSDGLSGLVGDEELRRTMEELVPQESVYRLIEQANENGGPDNITVVVARVQELGVEPPGVRQPVPIGGPEISNEDTARLFAPASANKMARNSESPVPGSPFLYNNGPLSSTEKDTAPQPTLKTRKPRGRLFAPTVTLLVLFILVAAGSGFYYFLHLSQAQTISSTLNAATRLITQAGTEVNHNPAQALQELSQGQQKLQDLQKNYILSSSAVSQLTNLQNQLVSETKTAITLYNQEAHVTLLPCTNAAPSSLNGGTAGALAVIQQANHSVVYYALSQDGKIYPLVPSESNQYSLGNPFALNGANIQIISIASAKDRIFALSQQMNNNTPGNYTINQLSPGQHTELQQPTHSQSVSAQNGQAPSLITAWNTGATTNVYVVLTSSSSTNSATILSYSVDNAKGTFSGRKSSQLSVSQRIVSVTATADRLFMLLGDGSIWSTPSNAISNPAQILTDQPIAPPLTAEPQNFKIGTTVPVVLPAAQKGQSPLSVAGMSANNPATLSAGIVTENGITQPHLFVTDPTNHRVLDLTKPLATSGGPGTTPNDNTKGATILTLAHQYVSSNYFSTIKSVAIDPGGSSATSIYILGQNAAGSENLLVVSTAAQNICASQAG